MFRVCVLKQIEELFIIDLEERAVSCHFKSLLIYLRIEFSDASRNDPLLLCRKKRRCDCSIQSELAQFTLTLSHRLFSCFYHRKYGSLWCWTNTSIFNGKSITLMMLQCHMLDDLIKTLPKHSVSFP